jgi:hypothetical protein
MRLVVSLGFDSQHDVAEMMRQARLVDDTAVLQYLFSVADDKGYSINLSELFEGTYLPMARPVLEYLLGRPEADLGSLCARDDLFMNAVTCGSREIVGRFLREGIVDRDTVLLQGRYGGSPLSYASDPAIVQMLLDAHVSVDPPMHLSVLKASCEQLCVDSVAMLLAAGAPVGPYNAILKKTDKVSSLILAVIADCTDEQQVDDKISIINRLFDAGVDPVHRLSDGPQVQYTALTRLVEESASEKCAQPVRVLRALLERAPELLEVAGGGGTPLMRAVAVDEAPLAVAEALLELGADIMTRDGKRRPLLQALLYPQHGYGQSLYSTPGAARRARDKLRLLLRAGADPAVTAYHRVTMPMLIASPESFMKHSVADSLEMNFSDHACAIFLADILDSVLASPPAWVTKEEES